MDPSPKTNLISKRSFKLKEIYRSLTGEYQLKSFSQEGEDRILARLFHGRNTGFYVDVGAHHPLRFSNTYLFYLRGWSGINIDANPGSMVAFLKRRPRDINLEFGVGTDHAVKKFYKFSDPALNSFDPDLSRSRDAAQNSFRIIGTSEVEVKPLRQLLDEFLPVATRIDFLTVDVEGLDLAVLRSNDWAKFRPAYVLIEELGIDLASLSNSATNVFLQAQGYTAFAKTVNTVFFRDETQ